MTDDEWLAWRSRGIGASEIAAVLGISPWGSPYSVWASKVLGTSGGEYREAMRWGKALEPPIIAEAERRLGIHVYGEQTRCTHPRYPWAICTVDGFFESESDLTEAEPGVIEIKTTSDYGWDELPAHYEAQVIWQLEVCELDRAWLACLHNGRRLSLWPIKANPDVAQKMLDIAERFWNRYVVTGEPPPLDGSDATSGAIAERYRESTAESVPLDDVAAEIDQLRQVTADIKTLDQSRTQLENRIKSAMGSASEGTVGGALAVTWRASKSKRLDIAAVRERHPDVAAECEYETESRRFLLRKVVS